MATTRQKKEETLQELKDKLAKAKSVAFGQYAGLSVLQLSEMRKKMREADVEFKVAKRTLFKLAAKAHGFELPDDMMEGTVGAAFSYEDGIAGPRIIKKMGKEFGHLKLMGGIMDGQVMTISQMRGIADLPSKEELMAKFVGLMRAPLQNFYGVIQSPLSSFLRGVQAYSESGRVS